MSGWPRDDAPWRARGSPERSIDAVGVTFRRVASLPVPPGGLSLRPRMLDLPLLGQLNGDPLGLGRAARSRRSRALRPRTAEADRVVGSVCPYCAVGCAQKVYVRDERVIQIEGDPDSPISRGHLCPKGSASKQLVNNPGRLDRVLYRAPHATAWSELTLDQAMEMIADRVLDARETGWQAADERGRTLNRTRGFAHLRGAPAHRKAIRLHKRQEQACVASQRT